MSDSANSRAESLATEAKACVEKRELQKAYQLAKEALSLAPTNSNVQSVISLLQKSDSNDQILPLCSSYVKTGNHEDGEKALQYLKQQSPIPFKDINPLATLLFDHANKSLQVQQAEPPALFDELTAAALVSAQLRVEFATRFSQQFAVGDPTRLFALFYNRGERSFNALLQTVVDGTPWASNEQHKAAKRDAFQLALGKLLDPALEHPEWLLTLVFRLLASHAEDLREQPQNQQASLLTPENFEIVLGWLDLRASQYTHSQAILATTKFLEEMKGGGKGEETLEAFVKAKVAKTHVEDLIVAFSATAACFPLCTQTASKLFLTSGFLEGLVQTLEHNAVGSRKSHTLDRVSLELMSAACIDKACREAISKNCGTWLDDVANTAEEEDVASLAALVLSKIGQEEPNAERSGIVANVDDLSSTLMSMTLNASSAAARQSAIEGLAYTSLKGKVKEEIASNAKVLQSLIDGLRANATTDAATFGTLTIFANLTAYRPPLTDEEKKMSQLKSYANSSKPPPEDPLDNDAQVAARCKKVLEAGLVPALALHIKKLSVIGLKQTSMILNALAREQKHRGVLSQQGSVKLLLQTIERLQQQQQSPSSGAETAPLRIAAHALARILISVNPNHVFSASTAPATSAIRPLLDLLRADPSNADSETRNLLPTFECLLALTNLASMEDPSVRDTIIKVSWADIEDLLLSSNMLVQRAAVELVCNLMASPQGVAKFADGSSAAKNRLHILLALADVEDFATRRAAGGALAMLTEWDAACAAVLDKEKGVKILLGMCEDESTEMRHRGVVCLLNLVSVPGEKENGAESLSHRARDKIRGEGGMEVLKGVVQTTREREILEIAVEVLKKII